MVGYTAAGVKGEAHEARNEKEPESFFGDVSSIKVDALDEFLENDM